jgi:hypothetical protein
MYLCTVTNHHINEHNTHHIILPLILHATPNLIGNSRIVGPEVEEDEIPALVLRDTNRNVQLGDAQCSDEEVPATMVLRVEARI